jgi:hypothetical protein
MANGLNGANPHIALAGDKLAFGRTMALHFGARAEDPEHLRAQLVGGAGAKGNGEAIPLRIAADLSWPRVLVVAQWNSSKRKR